MIGVLDFVGDFAERTHVRARLRLASDAAVLQGAQTWASGGSRLEVETRIDQAFQTWIEHASVPASCKVETVEFSQAGRFVAMKTSCSKVPRLGAVLLGQFASRSTVSVKAMFDESAFRAANAETGRLVWLAE